MYAEFTTSRPLEPFPDSEQLQLEARQFWRDLLAGAGDVPTGIKRMFSRYGSFAPEPFKHSGRQRTRRGWELLRGDAKTPKDAAGPLGRLAVAAGGALSFYTVSMVQLGLEALEHDARAQFDTTALRAVKLALRRVVSGPFISTVERGRVAERVHVHLICARGGCSVGRRSHVRLASLPRLGAYISKRPLWTRENAAAYVETVRAQGNPGRRLIRHGLGQSVTVAQVEALLGFPLFRAEPVSSCDVRAADAPTIPRIQKHIWFGGTPQALAKELLEPEPVELPRTLSGVLQRLAHRERPLPIRPAVRRTARPRHRPIITQHWGTSPPVAAAHIISLAN